jgi:threonyl-tRNA synthetase
VLQRAVSYRDLPLRLADFSPLHRNEASGALGGLTRLRKFAQDDAHIFCELLQVADEVGGCLDFVAAIYGLFGFAFRAKLSTRPAQHVGDVQTWDQAEAALKAALGTFLTHGGRTAAAPGSAAAAHIEVDEGGGAFYGPKIDVFVRDAVGREHQCATVQLDFQLPARFGLRYAGRAGALETPVMIHRAILGSLERFLGVLIEHTAGRWPFWINPRQVVVATVSSSHSAYADAIQRELAALPRPAPHVGGAAVYAEVDSSADTVPKKVRNGQVAQASVIAVVGDKEVADGTVTLRFRDAATVAEWAHAGGDAVPSSLQLTVARDVAVRQLRAMAVLPSRSAHPFTPPLHADRSPSGHRAEHRPKRKPAQTPDMGEGGD